MKKKISQIKKKSKETLKYNNRNESNILFNCWNEFSKMQKYDNTKKCNFISAHNLYINIKRDLFPKDILINLN
jgi:hypothetical protein